MPAIRKGKTQTLKTLTTKQALLPPSNPAKRTTSSASHIPVCPRSTPGAKLDGTACRIKRSRPVFSDRNTFLPFLDILSMYDTCSGNGNIKDLSKGEPRQGSVIYKEEDNTGTDQSSHRCRYPPVAASPSAERGSTIDTE